MMKGENLFLFVFQPSILACFRQQRPSNPEDFCFPFLVPQAWPGQFSGFKLDTANERV